MTGAFVAVVGPSGSGKDSIIEHTRAVLEGRGAIVFPRRQITRPSGAGEDHIPVSESEFDTADRLGEFALTWRAHDLAYGIPANVFDVVEAGGVVVANVSRGVLAQLPNLFANVRVVRVTVSEEVRLERIVARGREDAIAAASRVARLDPAPDYPADLEIVNDGTIEDASAQLAAFLTSMRDAARAAL
ncbi:ribose 1,5-bisphosphokinase [Glaciihabitans tibetensis]|uniref:Ribose 1,5-bisphosphate phosphokinase PhnN n=1 Tax=Glaciihabitans tibetensis TaxID=1266600 RepID=A0A2T0VEJ5_9MICO|nr:phosphonate metabolism protein/1,5-bisphosphokinase (PRPP-forming) PhnN [Glaciihabitans tibetensis]PRY68613.1 ribose 1,5-bisphosphokinase [Glaciihabitans tibetensis]